MKHKITIMGSKCIEAGCDNEGLHKVKTIDGLTFYCCEQHAEKWKEGIERARNSFWEKIKFWK